MAISFEKKDSDEYKKAADDMMNDASNLVNNFPESRDDADDILKVASGFAYVEPKRAFDYLNNLIYMANDLLTAQALLAKYNKRSSMFRDGEVIFTQIFNNSYASYGESLGKLAEHDLKKTESLSGQFQRQDIQIFTKMILAQSVLKKKIGLEGNRQFIVSPGF